MKPAAPISRRWPWIAILLVAIAFLTWDAAGRIKRSLQLSQSYGVAVNAPAPDPASVTGYQLGRRSLMLPVNAPDAQHWIVQAQTMRARGEWRVRKVDYDNVPEGRDVHWASPWRWWLVGLARIDRSLSGATAPLAIERAALWAGPAAFAVVFALFVPLVARRFGGWASLLMTAGMIGTAPFAEQFIAGNADHHGLASVCAMAMVGSLVVASAGRTEGNAKKWIVASSMAGAAGLWISAATLVPVLLGTGIGALGVLWRAPTAALAPNLWRRWGAIGGLGSLVAYAIEYGFGDFGWRLEVNHPVYAIAWGAGGDLLCRATRWRAAGKLRVNAREAAGWIAALGGVLLPPALISLLRSRVFLPADPFLGTVHNDYVVEGLSFARYLATRDIDGAVIQRGLLIVALGLSLAWLVRRSLAAGDKAKLMLAAGPALAGLALAFSQIRWWSVASGLIFVVVAVASAVLARAGLSRPATRTYRFVGLILFAPGLAGAVRGAWQAAIPIEGDVRRLAERDVAHRLRLQAGHDPLIVAATPNSTTSLIYYASARGLGTLFWENVDGQKKAAAVFGSTPEVARQHLARANVTHVVLFSWDETDAMCVRLHRQLPRTDPLPSDALAVALREGRVPAWLRPIPHRLPAHPLLREQRVLLFEVTEERPPDQVAVDTAAFWIEMGEAEHAQQLEPVLAGHPRSAAALAAVAGLQARRRDAASFARTVSRLMALLPQADGLRLEDRVRVAMILGIAGQTAEASAQLRAALRQADERTLRRLTPATLSDLEALSEALAVPLERWRELVSELLPPP